MGKFLDDLGLARQAKLRPIRDVARELGIPDEHLELHGPHKAKIRLELLGSLPPEGPRAKYVVVTAITPTPLGEGKTVTTIGLAMALQAAGRRSICTLRQPTLGPVFGVKGGATGGGRAQILPPEEINFHLTGDNHAVSAAHNLLAALVDNHFFHGNALGIDPGRISWRRVSEISDRALREVALDMGGGVMRRSGFDITAASEVMAILGLSTSIRDLRERVARIVVGFSKSGGPVTAGDLRAAGAMAVLLRHATKPNLLQRMDGGPCLMHAGPFGNIAQGTNSVIADRIASRLADVVVTEAGFGADLGFEKFIDLKCPVSGLWPDAAVVVATVRALKVHSGRFLAAPGKPLPPELTRENLEALLEGAANLRHMIGIVRSAGVPCVVAVNRFPDDTDREIEAVLTVARGVGADDTAVSECHARGAEGGADLARAVERAAARPSRPVPLVPLKSGVEGKIRTIATKIYGASDVHFEERAKRDLETIRRYGFDGLGVCMAKTQLSLSHDPKLLGVPTGFVLPIRAIEISAGAGFVYPLCGNVLTMPGLPSRPQAEEFDVDDAGRIVGFGGGEAT
jgi:formate--tetrahydrofolate ligase